MISVNLIKRQQFRFYPVSLALFLAAGCGREDVKSYTAPKEPIAAAAPEAHGDMDGHNHGAMAARIQPKVTYTTPEGWREAGPGEMRVAGFTIAATNGQTAQVAVTPLAAMVGKEALIVNMWRQQVGLSELSEAEAAQQLTAVDIGGEPGKMFDMTGKSDTGVAVRIVTAMAHRGDTSWFYKLQGDDELVTAQKPNFITFLKSVKIEAAAPATTGLPEGHPPIAGAAPTVATPTAPVPAREGGPTWAIPPGWKEVPGGQFLFAKFAIVGDGGAQAAVNVSTSAGDGGGLAANLNRWRGQLSLAPWSEAEVSQNVKAFDTAAGKATLVEMSGTDGRTGQPAALVGVLASNGGAAWFYKLMGDAKVVATQREAFEKFVKEVKY